MPVRRVVALGYYGDGKFYAPRVARYLPFGEGVTDKIVAYFETVKQRNKNILGYVLYVYTDIVIALYSCRWLIFVVVV